MVLVFEYAGQSFSLLDPLCHFSFTGYAARKLLRLIDLGQGLGQIDGIAAGQFRHCIYACGLQKFGILRTDAMNPVEVNHVGKLEDLFF